MRRYLVVDLTKPAGMDVVYDGPTRATAQRRFVALERAVFAAESPRSEYLLDVQYRRPSPASNN